MPSLEEFLNPKIEHKEYMIEKLPGLRACSTCDEDVNGALWDPIELVMSWRCSKNHETVFKVQ